MKKIRSVQALVESIAGAFEGRSISLEGGGSLHYLLRKTDLVEILSWLADWFGRQKHAVHAFRVRGSFRYDEESGLQEPLNVDYELEVGHGTTEATAGWVYVEIYGEGDYVGDWVVSDSVFEDMRSLRQHLGGPTRTSGTLVSAYAPAPAERKNADSYKHRIDDLLCRAGRPRRGDGDPCDQVRDPHAGKRYDRGVRYVPRKHAKSGLYVVWDTEKKAPVGQERMRLEQAKELARWMNNDHQKRPEATRPSTAADVAPTLDAVQQEIARRVALETTDAQRPSLAMDPNGVTPLTEAELLALKAQVEEDTASVGK